MSPRPFRAVTAAAAVLAALAAFAAPGSSAAAEPAAEPAPGPPVLDVNFPDPDIVKAGDTYHAYATNGAGKNIQHATSTDLASWSLDGDDVLPRLGDWAVPERGLVWAPEVFDNGAGFTMHYTARDRASDKQCIGVALAATPEGPFEPAGRGPLVCPERQGGAIDASSYTEGGQRYMLWKNDGNCCSTDTWLYVQPMNDDGTAVKGKPTPLIRQDRAWEGNVIEAPTLLKRDGKYVLLYSASFYDGNRYKTGYAVADRLTGPYTKVADPLLSTDTFGGAVRGPGGQDVVTGPDGRDRILFHGWSADRSRRAMYATGIGWAGGRPVVEGSKVLYQAENAVVNNARIRDSAGAHDGGAVGHIDYASSYVEFSVFAPAAGHRTLSVRYANGSLADSAPVTSSHLLTVGGKAAGRVDYPFTGWEKWATVDQRVRLDAGWNTVRLGRGTYYAELDSIEIT